MEKTGRTGGLALFRAIAGAVFLVAALLGCPNPAGGGLNPGGSGPIVTTSEDQGVLVALNPSSDLDGDGIPNGKDSDIDGDGLSNADELKYGSSPYIADTDGDGWSDGKEVELYDSTNRVFNPAVADMPRIQIVLKSEPQILMQYTASNGTSVEYATSTTSSYSTAHTVSNSTSHTTGTEYGWSVELKEEIELGAKIGVTLGSTQGVHGNYTSEDSHEWSAEDSNSMTSEAQQTLSASSSQDLTKTGGKIKYAIAFRNAGPISYTVQSMQLAAYRIDRGGSGLVSLIGGLSQEGGGFQSFTLGAGQESGIFSFVNANLTVGELLDLLDNPNGIVCDISGYSISSMNNQDFTQSETEIGAKTAKLCIDYGPGKAQRAEQYLVATKTKVNTSATSLSGLYNPLSLREVLAAAGLPFQTEGAATTDGITGIRGIGQDSATNALWYVVHEYTNPISAQRETTIYAASKCSYKIDDVMIRTGDAVSLIYSVDADGDGVPLRVETMLGTSDSKVDSDGDGLSDFVELSSSHTNPANPDTDGDGFNDKEDSNPLTASVLAPVGDFKATAVTYNSITLGWSSLSDSRETGLFVLRGDTAFADLSPPPTGYVVGTSGVVANIADGSTEFTDSGLSAETSYYYAALPYRKVGSSYTYGSVSLLSSAKTAKIPSKTLTINAIDLECKVGGDPVLGAKYSCIFDYDIDGTGYHNLVNTGWQDYYDTAFRDLNDYTESSLRPADSDGKIVTATVSTTWFHTLTVHIKVTGDSIFSGEVSCGENIYTYYYDTGTDTWTGNGITFGNGNIWAEYTGFGTVVVDYRLSWTVEDAPAPQGEGHGGSAASALVNRR